MILTFRGSSISEVSLAEKRVLQTAKRDPTAHRAWEGCGPGGRNEDPSAPDLITRMVYLQRFYKTKEEKQV